jgi:hypothetical protein
MKPRLTNLEQSICDLMQQAAELKERSDPIDAAVGRWQQRLVPVAHELFIAERALLTPPHAIFAAASISASFLMLLPATAIKPEHHNDVCDRTAQLITERLKRVMHNAQQQLALKRLN